MESNLVCNHVSDEKNQMNAKWESDLLITSMITDRIGQQEVLLPINGNHFNKKKTPRTNIFSGDNVFS